MRRGGSDSSTRLYTDIERAISTGTLFILTSDTIQAFQPLVRDPGCKMRQRSSRLLTIKHHPHLPNSRAGVPDLTRLCRATHQQTSPTTMSRHSCCLRTPQSPGATVSRRTWNYLPSEAQPCIGSERVLASAPIRRSSLTRRHRLSSR